MRARRVVFPASVRRIEAGAFEGCVRLEEAEFDWKGALEAVEERTFMGTSVKRVMLPGGVKTIGECAFGGCVRLEAV